MYLAMQGQNCTLLTHRNHTLCIHARSLHAQVLRSLLLGVGAGHGRVIRRRRHGEGGALVDVGGILCFNSSESLERKAGKITSLWFYNMNGTGCSMWSCTTSNGQLRHCVTRLYYRQFIISSQQKVEHDHMGQPVHGLLGYKRSHLQSS